MISANRITDRYAQISVLATSARNLIERGTWPMLLLLGGAQALLVFKGHAGSAAFALIAIGCLILLGIWKSAGKGLPIVPMLALQTLIAYGLPIINNNETVQLYREEAITSAGFEILVFCLSFAGFWRFGMQVIATSPATCYALQGFEEEGTGRLSRIGLTLIGSAASFELLQSVQLLDPLLSILPSGAISIINVLLSAVGACGFFLVGMLVGRGQVASSLRLMFWVFLGLHCFISASAFLLSSTITIIFSALIGLFWGSGRVPWRIITTIFVVLSFLNLGKFTMRERYWHPNENDPIPQFALSEMPGHYAEWLEASIDSLSTPDSRRNDSADKARKSQSLSERINNLQNLLYVIDAIGPGKIPPLGGDTYTLIPPLLVPRILWPDKPRTHEGQVMLNVHFGRQDLNSTYSTYVAWGLQAEAYGNFGPVAGSIFIGACLGLFFAWVEQMTTRKILLSLEGFLSFTLFLGMANSFEMVASVLITSIFQAFIPIVVACMPFVRHTTPTPPVVSSDEPAPSV